MIIAIAREVKSNNRVWWEVENGVVGQWISLALNGQPDRFWTLLLVWWAAEDRLAYRSSGGGVETMIMMG